MEWLCKNEGDEVPTRWVMTRVLISPTDLADGGDAVILGDLRDIRMK
jgi:hypothetical protein